MVATYPGLSPSSEFVEGFAYKAVLRQIEILMTQLLNWHRQRDLAEFENNHAQVRDCDRQIEYLDNLWEQYQAIADLLEQRDSNLDPGSESDSRSERLRQRQLSALIETVRALEHNRPVMPDSH